MFGLKLIKVLCVCVCHDKMADRQRKQSLALITGNYIRKHPSLFKDNPVLRAKFRSHVSNKSNAEQAARQFIGELVSRMSKLKMDGTNYVMLHSGLTLFHGTNYDFDFRFLSPGSYYSTNVNPPVGLIGEKVNEIGYDRMNPRVYEMELVRNVRVKNIITTANDPLAAYTSASMIQQNMEGVINIIGEEEIRLPEEPSAYFKLVNTYYFPKERLRYFGDMITTGSLVGDSKNLGDYDSRYMPQQNNTQGLAVRFVDRESRLFSYHALRKFQGASESARAAVYMMIRKGREHGIKTNTMIIYRKNTPSDLKSQNPLYFEQDELDYADIEPVGIVSIYDELSKRIIIPGLGTVAKNENLLNAEEASLFWKLAGDMIIGYIEYHQIKVLRMFSEDLLLSTADLQEWLASKFYVSKRIDDYAGGGNKEVLKLKLSDPIARIDFSFNRDPRDILSDIQEEGAKGDQKEFATFKTPSGKSILYELMKNEHYGVANALVSGDVRQGYAHKLIKETIKHEDSDILQSLDKVFDVHEDIARSTAIMDTVKMYLVKIKNAISENKDFAVTLVETLYPKGNTPTPYKYNAILLSYIVDAGLIDTYNKFISEPSFSLTGYGFEYLELEKSLSQADLSTDLLVDRYSEEVLIDALYQANVHFYTIINITEKRPELVDMILADVRYHTGIGLLLATALSDPNRGTEAMDRGVRAAGVLLGHSDAFKDPMITTSEMVALGLKIIMDNNLTRLAKITFKNGTRRGFPNIQQVAIWGTSIYDVAQARKFPILELFMEAWMEEDAKRNKIGHHTILLTADEVKGRYQLDDEQVALIPPVQPGENMYDEDAAYALALFYHGNQRMVDDMVAQYERKRKRIPNHTHQPGGKKHKKFIVSCMSNINN